MTKLIIYFIATQLYYTYPFVYTRNVPASMLADYPSLKNIADNTHKTTAPYTNMASFTSVGGKQFWHFAKTGSYGKGIHTKA